MGKLRILLSVAALVAAQAQCALLCGQQSCHVSASTDQSNLPPCHRHSAPPRNPAVTSCMASLLQADGPALAPQTPEVVAAWPFAAPTAISSALPPVRPAAIETDWRGSPPLPGARTAIAILKI
jgi:hypothetical protein